MWVKCPFILSLVLLFSQTVSQLGYSAVLRPNGLGSELEVPTSARLTATLNSRTEWNLSLDPDALSSLEIELPTASPCSPLQDAQFRSVARELGSTLFATLRGQLESAQIAVDSDEQSLLGNLSWNATLAYFLPTQPESQAVGPQESTLPQMGPELAQNDSISESRSEPIFVQQDSVADPTESPEESNLARNIYRYSEAFAPEQEIVASGVGNQMLSREYPVLAEAEMIGWRLSFGLPLGLADHWKTLQWVNWGGDNSDPLPIDVSLLSNNTVRLLGWMGGAPVNEKKAIIFGKVAAGWKLAVDAPIIYLSTAAEPKKLAPDEGAESERYFAWVNVDPGFQWVRLQNLKDSSQKGVVFAPTVEGTATELDLTAVHSGRVITGQIELARSRLNADEMLEGTVVRLSGLDVIHTQTLEEGYFQLEGITTFGKFPVYLDSQGPSLFSYIHRYRAMPWNIENLGLIRLSSRKIQDWQTQHRPMTTKGHSVGGVIIAAFPNLVQTNPDTLLMPRVQMFTSMDHSMPTTYSIRANGNLEAPKQLVQYEERVLSLGVPQGVGLLQLLQAGESPGQDPIEKFSEAAPVGPGVVYVMGPE